MVFLTVKSYVLRVAKKIATFLNKNIYYTNKYGFKQIVSMKSYTPPDRTTQRKINKFEAGDFYLSFDGLKDEYSFIDTKIVDSPHYKLIESCHSGNFDNCTYIDFEHLGRIDARDTVLYDKTFHIKAYKKAYEDMMNENDKPIIYYVIKDKKYVLDGKHRLALYCYFGKKVSGIEVPLSSQRTPYVKALYRKMLKSPKYFTKHKEVIETIMAD